MAMDTAKSFSKLALWSDKSAVGTDKSMSINGMSSTVCHGKSDDGAPLRVRGRYPALQEACHPSRAVKPGATREEANSVVARGPLLTGTDNPPSPHPAALRSQGMCSSKKGATRRT